MLASLLLSFARSFRGSGALGDRARQCFFSSVISWVVFCFHCFTAPSPPLGEPRHCERFRRKVPKGTRSRSRHSIPVHPSSGRTVFRCVCASGSGLGRVCWTASDTGTACVEVGCECPAPPRSTGPPLAATYDC